MCFCCKVVSYDWTISDDPWIRHIRSSPHCQYLIEQKGREFITNTLQEFGEYRPSAEEFKINVSLPTYNFTPTSES